MIRPPKPHVVMFCDASRCPEKNRAGWGCWIKGDGRTSVTAGGPLQMPTDINTAEISAILCGLKVAAAVSYFQQTDRFLMIQSDNTVALGTIMKVCPDAMVSDHVDGAPVHQRRKRVPPKQYQTANEIAELLAKLSLVPIVRHVRGHQKGEGRQWVNRKCDELAKAGSRGLITRPAFVPSPAA